MNNRLLLMTPSPDSASKTLRKDLGLCTMEGVVASPMVFLTIGGNFILAALLIQVFAVNHAFYGLLASLPAWANTFQLLLVPILSRYFSARTIMLANAWMQLLVWTIFTALLSAFPPAGHEVPATFLLFFLAAMALTQALTGVGWTTWLQEWIPPRIRGRYLGRRNRWCSLAMILFLLAAGFFVETKGGELSGYLSLFWVVIVLRLVGIGFLHRIQPSRQDSVQVLAPAGWTAQMQSLRQNTSFRNFVFYAALSAFWMNLAGPFYPVFMYENLDLSLRSVKQFIIVGSLTGALAWPFWGRLCDRFGAKPVIIASMILWETPNLLWSFLTPQTSFVLYGLFAWGGCVACGFFMGTFNLLLKIVPRSAKLSGISVNLAASSLAAGIAPILAGFIFQNMVAEAHIDLAYRVLFFIKPLCLILCLVLLRNVVETDRREMNAFLGGMRMFRSLLATQGMSFLVNFHLVKKRPRR